jgi:hypothetical protein
MLKIKFLGNSWVLAAVVGSSLALGGCNGSQVAATLGVVGIAAGAVAVGVAVGDNDHHDRRRWRPAPPPPRRGRPGRDRGRFSIDPMSVSSESFASTLSASDDITSSWIEANRAGTQQLAQDPSFQKDWADHFSMSNVSAQRLLMAFVKAQSGDKTSLTEIGLSDKDLAKLAGFKMITDDGILSVSRTLGQNSQATRDMIQEIITQAKNFRIDN